MHNSDIQLIEREDLWNGEVIERLINRAGTPHTAILKHGVEVASAPTSEEASLIRWWKRYGRKMWRNRRKKKEGEN